MGSLLAAMVTFATPTHVSSAMAGGPVGVTTISVTAPDRGRELTVTLWYPAQPGGTSVVVGDNAVFRGVEGLQDAPIADGRFPTVLVLHGGLRSAPHLSGWIGSRLAEQGFLVATVQGPRLGPGDAKRAVAEIWQRPADLSTAMTALAEEPEWSKHMNPEQIAALGFFLGGTSVLSLAGGRLNADDFMRSCDRGGHGLDCAWLQANGVDLRSVDVPSLTRSNLDRRVKVAIVVDPELSASFASESLAGIAIPVEIINLGRPETTLPGLNASELESASPHIAYTALPNATRFSAFSLCKPQGAAILAQDGGNDAICRDGAGENRKGIHQELAALILDRLRQWLPVSRE
jgi:predicted dienelactone hydrolase